jgi:BarA-like signal transduction histidine kinase
MAHYDVPIGSPAPISTSSYYPVSTPYGIPAQAAPPITTPTYYIPIATPLANPGQYALISTPSYYYPISTPYGNPTQATPPITTPTYYIPIATPLANPGQYAPISTPSYYYPVSTPYGNPVPATATGVLAIGNNPVVIATITNTQTTISPAGQPSSLTIVYPGGTVTTQGTPTTTLLSGLNTLASPITVNTLSATAIKTKLTTTLAQLPTTTGGLPVVNNPVVIATITNTQTTISPAGQPSSLTIVYPGGTVTTQGTPTTSLLSGLNTLASPITVNTLSATVIKTTLTTTLAQLPTTTVGLPVINTPVVIATITSQATTVTSLIPGSNPGFTPFNTGTALPVIPIGIAGGPPPLLADFGGVRRSSATSITVAKAKVSEAKTDRGAFHGCLWLIRTALVLLITVYF